MLTHDMYQHFISFYSQIIFHSMDIAHITHSNNGCLQKHFLFSLKGGQTLLNFRKHLMWLEQRVMGRSQLSSQPKEKQIIAFLGELGRGILISMKSGVPRAEPNFFPVLI